jgi:Secretion system C-terminal sorting domain
MQKTNLVLGFMLIMLFVVINVVAQDVTFTKEDYADWTLEENQDRITDIVWITRQESNQLFNIFSEEEAEGDVSPMDTEWIMGSTYDIDPADYTNFKDAHGGSASSLPGETMSMHLITDDLYFDVLFHSWTSDSGGGFSYTRTPVTTYLNYNPTTFIESSDNLGNIQNSLTITMGIPDGNSFTGSNGSFAASKYTATNVPAGLTMVIIRNGDTELSVSLTGSATNHKAADEISNLEIVFNNTAFTNGDASSVTNSTKSDVSIDYIQNWNVASSGGDFTTIAAALAASGNRDIINIATGTYTEAGLFINKDLTIQGAGADVTIVQAHASQNSASDRVFRINYGITVLIDGITIRHGKKTDSGAGIMSQANLTITNCSITNNNIVTSGIRYGAGIACYSGNLSITNSTISNNYITSSYYDGEYNLGSAIFAQGDVDIINCTITNNSVSGAFNTQGAISINSDHLNITNSTVANNGCGGIRLNQNSILTISNTILSNNASSDYFMNTNNGTINDNGYNVVENQTYNGTATNWNFTGITNILYNYQADGTANTAWSSNNVDLSNQNLNLSATLADNSTTNGTQTLALSSGSFAINAGTDTGAPETDQRGLYRNGTTDIGAFEFEGGDSPLPVILSAFFGTYNGQINLYWATQSETDNLGFNLYRSENENGFEADEYLLLNNELISGMGTTFMPTNYSFTDEYMVLEGHSYYYWLESVSTTNELELFGPVSVEILFEEIITVLSEFSAIYENTNPVLNWSTASETDNLGFIVQRSEDPNGYVLADCTQLNNEIITGMGTTSYETDYTFDDENFVVEGHTYFYWLESVNPIGDINVFGPVSLEIPDQGGIPNAGFETSLNPNYPNPFNPETTISFNIKENETGILSIYNLKGEKILKENFETGNHQYHWNAEGLASGMYFYKLSSPTTTITKKMILMK